MIYLSDEEICNTNMISTFLSIVIERRLGDGHHNYLVVIVIETRLGDGHDHYLVG